VGVSVGIGVAVGAEVAVKVGLGVLVGVAVASGLRASSELAEQATRTAIRVIATNRITTRFLIVIVTPL
jgi:hypothetical protein